MDFSFFHALGHGVIENGCHLVEAVGGHSDGLCHRGVDFAHERQDVKAYFVAHHVIHQVGTVGDISHTLLLQESLNVRPPHTKERPHHMVARGSDARQTMDARSSYQVEQDGLHRIITMMGHRHGLCTDVVSQLLKIIIPETPCCHFNADMPKFGIFTSCEVDRVERDGKFFAKATTKILIPFGLLPTKLEIAMGSLNLIPQMEQDMQQRHAVGSS